MVIDKQELQQGLCWRRGTWLSGVDVQWGGGGEGLGNSVLLLGFAPDALGEAGALCWGTGPQSCSQRDQRREEKSCEMMHTLLLSKCKVNLQLKFWGFFCTCHWHLLVATQHIVFTNDKTSRIT